MITDKEYLKRKPDASRMYESDYFYLDMANSMLKAWNDSALFSEILEEGRKEVVLGLTGYMLDIVADLGLWRAFTSHCMMLYSRPVPFYRMRDDHVPYEFNRCDVEFLVWYFVALLHPDSMPPHPLDSQLTGLTDLVFPILEKAYDDAPAPEGLIKTNDLEFYQPDDEETIARLGQWMFWSSYLLVPAFASNMALMLGSIDPKDKKGLVKAMGDAQAEVPTGPLALFLGEWVWLVVAGHLPKEKRRKGEHEEPKVHPYYERFTVATQGSELAFFNDYKEMNRFLGQALGWDPDADNLPALKNHHDFTIMVNREKGMLIARDVARCIRHPENPYYDKEYASAHDFELLVQKGRCPIDLTLRCLKDGLLPDLIWPGAAEGDTMALDNADFIARCFLQQYYRAV